MTAQEQQMLQGLTDRINQTKLQEKDADAEHFLQSALARNPDAVYILAQTTLVQQYALEQAQKQLADLKQQLAQQPAAPKHEGSFLGNLLHLNDEPSRPAPPPPQQQMSQPQYAPVANYAPQQSSPQSSSVFGGGAQPAQSGGFLRSAMQTATGVAAGALAFQGIESLMHGFGGGGFGGGSGFGNFGGGGSGRPEEVVNNYYGDSGSGQGDIEDRRDNSGRSSFADSNDNADDSNSNDLSGNDDNSSSSDDSSLFDSGGDDSGSSDDNSF